VSEARFRPASPPLIILHYCTLVIKRRGKNHRDKRASPRNRYNRYNRRPESSESSVFYQSYRPSASCHTWNLTNSLIHKMRSVEEDEGESTSEVFVRLCPTTYSAVNAATKPLP
jgi:hypothetical protein